MNLSFIWIDFVDACICSEKSKAIPSTEFCPRLVDPGEEGEEEKKNRKFSANCHSGTFQESLLPVHLGDCDEETYQIR